MLVIGGDRGMAGWCEVGEPGERQPADVDGVVKQIGGLGASPAGVVGGTQELAVVLRGDPVEGIGGDVVDVAPVSGCGARGHLAATVADLDGATGGAGEEALGDPDVEDT